MKKTIRLILCLMLMITLASCTSGGENLYTPGTYTGVGTSEVFGYNVTVEVTVDEKSITDIKVVEEDFDFDDPFESIPSAVIQAGSTEVDNVSGSTETADALKAAIDDALAKARGESAS